MRIRRIEDARFAKKKKTYLLVDDAYDYYVRKILKGLEPKQSAQNTTNR